jgi:hypothetical protein
MLMAAAILTEDPETAASLLRRAVEAGGGPATWAVYVEHLFKAVPSYSRLGTAGFDPEDHETISQHREWLSLPDVRNRLPEEDAAGLLEALHAWQRADPDNALPLVVEAWYLYGLERDEEAFEVWQRAGSVPIMSDHHDAQVSAVARLLAHMGMPEADALQYASSMAAAPLFYAKHRAWARMAFYEGRVAQMGGRHDDAVSWWNAGIAIGRHTQESADTAMAFLVGVPIEAIAAHAVWRWCSEEETGIPGGILVGGDVPRGFGMKPAAQRLMFGDQHEFYLGQVGEAADIALRDSLVAASVRSGLVAKYRRQFDIMTGWAQGLRLLAAAYYTAAWAAFLLLAFFVVRGRAGRSGDREAPLRPPWHAALAVVPVLSLVPGVVKLYGQPQGVCVPPANVGADALMASLSLGAGLAIFIPLVAALPTRRAGAPIWTAWRGNLGTMLPVTVAMAGVLYLGLSLAALSTRAHWVAEWHTTGLNEMDRLRDGLGGEWRNPTIPPDAWRGTALTPTVRVGTELSLRSGGPEDGPSYSHLRWHARRLAVIPHVRGIIRVAESGSEGYLARADSPVGPSQPCRNTQSMTGETENGTALSRHVAMASTAVLRVNAGAPRVGILVATVSSQAMPARGKEKATTKYATTSQRALVYSIRPIVHSAAHDSTHRVALTVADLREARAAQLAGPALSRRRAPNISPSAPEHPGSPRHTPMQATSSATILRGRDRTRPPQAPSQGLHRSPTYADKPRTLSGLQIPSILSYRTFGRRLRALSSLLECTAVEVFRAAVALVARSMVPSARSAGQQRLLFLQRAIAVGEPPGELAWLRDENRRLTSENRLLKSRLGAVGKHGSIAVAERVILTLKDEWLKRVPVIRGLNHLSRLLRDFEIYYNEYRGHTTLGGAVPSTIHRGEQWSKPGKSEKGIPENVKRHVFPDTQITAYRLAA